jgi:hypothetical protein
MLFESLKKIQIRIAKAYNNQELSRDVLSRYTYRMPEVYNKAKDEVYKALQDALTIPECYTNNSAFDKGKCEKNYYALTIPQYYINSSDFNKHESQKNDILLRQEHIFEELTKDKDENTKELYAVLREEIMYGTTMFDFYLNKDEKYTNHIWRLGFFEDLYNQLKNNKQN